MAKLLSKRESALWRWKMANLRAAKAFEEMAEAMAEASMKIELANERARRRGGRPH